MAQNGQAIPQPAWLETQTVIRSDRVAVAGYRISTLSTRVPSSRRHSVLRVVPASVST